MTRRKLQLKLLAALAIASCGSCSLFAQLSITGPGTVNVTPSSFSVVWATSPGATPAISVFADPAGATNLAGQVGVEFYPLNTGNPAFTNSYQQRADLAALRQQTAGLGLVLVRVSDCVPGTTYYYQLQVSNTNGQQTVWPANPPLAAVTLPPENAFVVQSRQLVITLPPTAPPGSIVVLSNSNSSSLLAAVAGDGVASNQVWFSIGDLIALSGNTNYLPLGNLDFTANVLGGSSATASQTYALDFTGQFLVGQESQVSTGSGSVTLTLGSTVLLEGSAGSIPISVSAGPVTNLSFTLVLPTSRLTNVSLQALVPQLGTPTLQQSGSNTFLATFPAAAGQSLQGNLQLAQLNFTAVSNQTSAFVPISPRFPSGANTDGSAVATFAVQSGRAVIVGPQPLLEAFLTAGPARSLALYGIPGASYELQSSTNPSNPGAWSNFLRVPMTNLVEMFSNLDTSRPVVLYRAYQFTADPPLLEARVANQKPLVMLYGMPGTNYQLQYATNFSGVVTWYPLLSYTLTNSFLPITNPGPAYPAVIYRAKRP